MFKPTISKLFKKLGNTAYIRNGHGHGFISDNFLFDNKYLEIGIGYIVSGYGDWGGGFDHAAGHALKVTIDKDFIIQKIETDSFYNSESSQSTEKIAKKLAKRLKAGSRFKVNHDQVKEHLSAIFAALPVNGNIGYDIFKSPHMLEFSIKG